jgi:metal-dependent amidase/aminoacylase/carboxypeptidase family protein
MLKLREHAIELKEKTEKKLLKQLQKANQLSPRTYERKRRDLETWVSKEQEEVKRTRKVFEEEWHKTQNIIKLT